MSLSFLAMPLLCALHSFPAAVTTDWQTDYNKAKQIALTSHKPLAVFVGEGSEGWNKISSEGPLDDKIKQTLANGFVALYVDKSTDSGKALADVLEVRAHAGLVISDNSVKLQAFSHSGTVKGDDLLTVLTKFADATQPVVATETLAKPAPVVYYVPPAGGCAGGNCPRQAGYTFVK